MSKIVAVRSSCVLFFLRGDRSSLFSEKRSSHRLMESLGSLGGKVKFCTSRPRSRGPNSVPKVRPDHEGVRCGRWPRESEYRCEDAETKLLQNREAVRWLRRQRGGRKFGGPKMFFPRTRCGRRQ